MPIENPERQINPHPHVTIRHARHSLHLLLLGATHAIVESATNKPEAMAHAHSLLAGLREELDGWEITE